MNTHEPILYTNILTNTNNENIEESMQIETLKIYIDSIIKLKFSMDNFSELIDFLNSDDVYK